MKKTFITIFTLFLTVLPFVSVIAVPQQARAESILLVDCKYGNPDANGRPIPIPGTNPPEYECGFLDLIAEAKKLMDFAFLAALPITLIALTWSGIEILLAQGNTSKLTQAKNRMVQVIWGFVIVLTAWVLVYTITSYLLEPQFYDLFLDRI